MGALLCKLWEAVRKEWGSDWQGICVYEEGMGSLGSISVPPRFGFSRSISLFGWKYYKI